MLDTIINFLTNVPWQKIVEDGLSQAFALLLLSSLVLVLPKSWGVSLWRRFKRKYRLDELKLGREAFPYVKKDIKRIPFGKWNVWSIDDEDFEIDPLFPDSFSATAFVPAKIFRSKNYQGYFRLTAHCYSEVPSKLQFVLTTQGPVKIVRRDPNGNPSVLIKIGEEDTRPFEVNVSSINPRFWYLNEFDNKLLESSLLKLSKLKSPRMFVRWAYHSGSDIDVVTAEFDLTGAKEALAEIKKMCKDHRHKLNSHSDKEKT